VKKEVAKKEKSPGQEDKEKFLDSKSSDPRLTALRTDLQKTKGVDKVTLPLVNKRSEAAVYIVTATTAPSSRATEDLVSTLRNDVIPEATKGKQMSADVGGTTVSYIDLASEISSNLPLVIGIVLVLSFFLLLLAFRSLLVPLKAVVMNVFSILAAFGVVTYAFNHGWTAPDRPRRRHPYSLLRAFDDVRYTLRPLQGLRSLLDDPRPRAMERDRRSA
jgi:hypothetical protein